MVDMTILWVIFAICIVCLLILCCVAQAGGGGGIGAAFSGGGGGIRNFHLPGTPRADRAARLQEGA